MLVKPVPLAHVQIQPNEHALGPLARLHLYSSYRGISESAAFVTNDLGSLTAGVLWRPAFNDVYRYWGMNLSLNEFVQGHTLINYYRGFLPLGMLACVENQKRLLAPLPRVIRYTMQWRYCSICVGEDIDSYGLPYFHIEHQLPALTRCPAHDALLRSGCNACGNDWHKLGQLLTPPLEPQCDKCESPISLVNDFMDDDVSWLQKTSYRLLQGEFESLNLPRLQKAYRDHLGVGSREGILNLRDRAIVQEAQNLVDNYFDPRLYHLIFTNADMAGQQKRSPSLSIYKAAFITKLNLPPIVHLLIIRVLFGEIENIPGL